jgi:hypothetical protein
MESIKHLDKLKEYIKKDVEKLLNVLLSNYDIYQHGNLINKEVLLNKLISDLDNVNTCNAVINAKLCKNKCYNTFNYCKKHIVQETFTQNTTNSQNTINTQNNSIPLRQNALRTSFELGKVCKIITNPSKLTNYSKKFINDTLYYITDKSIFNTDLECVGYVSDDDNYILTDDPFILQFV